MAIVLVRHGETPLNAARTLQPADTPLSAIGLAQAQAVARRLAGLQPAGIVSSDLPRAAATAQAIAFATSLPVVFTSLLQERNFGDWRGRAYDSLGFNPLAQDSAPPGGESGADFQRRVAQAFEHIARMRASLQGPLVVVTHGLVIRAVLAAHAPASPANHAAARIGNTSVTVLSGQAPHAVELLDCTRHLGENERDDLRSLSGG